MLGNACPTCYILALKEDTARKYIPCLRTDIPHSSLTRDNTLRDWTYDGGGPFIFIRLVVSFRGKPLLNHPHPQQPLLHKA